MTVSNYFDLSRFWLLLRLELTRNLKGILMIFEITFGLLFFFGLLLNVVLEEKKLVYEHVDNYAFTLLIGGFIISSLAFKDLGSTLKRQSYLMVPVSTLEKFVCMWLLSSVGWVILYTLAFYLYSLIANAVGGILFSQVTFRSFDPTGTESLIMMRSYFVTQGIFLVGATQFKGYVFPKTLAVLILLALVFGTLFYFILIDVFMMDHICVVPENCELMQQSALYGYWDMVKVFFWWVLPPLSWVLAFMGLKEQEV